MESLENVRRVGGNGKERIVEAVEYLFLVSGNIDGVGEAGHVR